MNSQEIMNREIAFFKSCRSKKGGRNVSLTEILDGTKNGKWSAAVTALRRAPFKSPEYATLKRDLPCFMLSASTATGGHKATDIEQHSGLLQLDIDGPGEFEAAELRDRLAADPHVLAAWISPGGAGVKGIMLCAAQLAKHREAFSAASAYVRDRYGVQMDQKCSDPCRLCFVSFDPDLRLNLRALPLPLPEQEAEPEAGAPLTSDSSPSLPPASTSCILHNSGALFRKFPALKPIYDLHVRRRIGTPQPGLRNAALVELVASNFCVVHPNIVLDFSNEFYRDQPGLFADYPHGQWMKEARSALKGCLADYGQKNLGPMEMELYLELSDENHAAAFRICRSLACCESNPEMQPPEFFLSFAQLGARLGVVDTPAWRIMKMLRQRGVVEILKRGDLRAAGKKAAATRWRWCFPLPVVK